MYDRGFQKTQCWFVWFNNKCVDMHTQHTPFESLPLSTS